MTDDHDHPPSPSANPGYAVAQLARALAAADHHDDPAARAGAARKAEAWLEVFMGMIDGSLTVGSRTPVVGTPAWATLEVVSGGFATGTLLAEGPLREHERAWLDRIGGGDHGAPRALLNLHFLTEAGLAELRDMLATGRYRIEVPEEGALLAVAWLFERGHGAGARAILDAIAPFFARLRFYPVPHAATIEEGDAVHVQTVGDTVAALERIGERERRLAEREAVQIWAPLLDRVVSLFLDTVAGTDPAVADDGTITGGWPCQRYAEGWALRASQLLAELEGARARHRRCRAPHKRSASLAQLRGIMAVCARDPQQLSGLDVSRVRRILAHVIARRGRPDSERCRALRVEQARQVAAPTVRELSRVVLGRLGTYRRDGGLDSVEPLVAPITDDEAARFRVPAGASCERLRPRLLRSLDAPVEALVDAGVIPSGEVLARVIPQLTGHIGAAGIADPSLRRLYAAAYRAFRRRRSLLLLQYASQVKLDELPWIAALAPFRADTGETRGTARAVLDRVTRLAITAYPQVILPNKLLQEIRALAIQAAVDLPIVDEIASDIFMGGFTVKYLRAAQQAAALLRGSLYERYYGIDYRRIERIDDVRSEHGTKRSAAFDELCRQRAGVDPSRWSVAANGMILEQEQILTTHNLAPLSAALGLVDALAPLWPELARRAFTWIAVRLHRVGGPRMVLLRTAKNAAYAWRQMVYFLAVSPRAAQDEFLAWAEADLSRRGGDLRARMRPAIGGLALAVAGGSLDAPPPGLEVRRVTGWTTGYPWLLGPDPEPRRR